MSKLKHGESYTDCRTAEGITVGLVDTIINSARLLRGRERTQAVEDALQDLRSDEDLAELLELAEPDRDRLLVTPSHWANALGATITNEVKLHNLSLGGAPATVAEGYTQPLYVSQGDAEQLQDELRQMTVYRDNAAKKITDLRYALTRSEKQRDTSREEANSLRRELRRIRGQVREPGGRKHE